MNDMFTEDTNTTLRIDGKIEYNMFEDVEDVVIRESPNEDHGGQYFCDIIDEFYGLDAQDKDDEKPIGHVTYRYGISPTPFTLDDYDVAMLDAFFEGEGVGMFHCYEAYSSVTGFLWSNRSFQIAKHEIVETLIASVDKYLSFEMTLSPLPSQ